MNNLIALRNLMLYSNNSSNVESEGLAPLSFIGKKGALKNYKIYGNTYQERKGGTNIIKTTSVTLEGTEVDISVTGDTAPAVTETYVLAFVTVGCTYTDNTLALFEVTYSDDTVVSVPPSESYKTLNEDGKTLTGIKCVNKCGCTGTVKNISCYTGRKPYEDNYSEIFSVGDLNSDTVKYEIPVTVRGKNLISVERDMRSEYGTGETIEKGADYVIAQMSASAEDVTPGSTNYSSGRFGLAPKTAGTTAFNNCVFKDIKPNTTYTLSYDFEYFYFPENVSKVYQQCQIIMNESSYPQSSSAASQINKRLHNKLTFTTPETISKLELLFSLNSSKVKFSNIMLEEGGSETDYERYAEPVNYTIQLDEPLRSVNGKTDYIDFKTKKVVRNVFEKVVRGTDVTFESSTFKNSYGWNAFEMDLPFEILLEKYEKLGLCTYFDNANNAFSHSLIKPYLTQRTGQAYQGIYFVTTPTSSQKLADFRVWVEEKHSSGCPLKVVWGRTNPIEENISLPWMQSFEGTTIIEINTAIKPSKVSVEHLTA